jgi:acetyl esterase/lipase
VSWQNVAISLLLRTLIKPLSRGKPDFDLIRKRFNKPWLKARIPAGWYVRQNREGEPKGEWIEPIDGAVDDRVLLYFHGGAYALCSPETHRPITIGLAIASDIRVFVLDYRLAPEHPFPSAIEDALEAYRWLIASGVPADRLMLGGDSAGGGLALAALLSLKNAGETLPAGAVLFSPWTDLAATGASVVTNSRSDVLFDGTGVPKGARIYLGRASAKNPLASPLYGDLTGFPPLYIQASQSEVLLDDSVRLADKARAAGVTVEFAAWPGLPHVWQIFTPFMPEAKRAIDEAAGFIRRRLPPS